ncbi:MAG: amidohydrolase [Spirochaetales bacterium]|nr:amidohydrolase [Spirochaetales bacterium]
MRRKSYIFAKDNTPLKPRYPAIDAHNHLWGDPDIEKIVKTMDEVGIVSYCDLTANSRVEWTGSGYSLSSRSTENFFNELNTDYPGKFYCFTLAEFARPEDEPLFDNAEEFATQCAATLVRHVSLGAKGLKILKQFGLHYRDSKGEILRVDDERFSPIWNEAARLDVPVLIHQSDPYGFFESTSPENEHYDTLKKYTSWSFADSQFPSKQELLERRDRLVQTHPGTTFILPHVANFPENLTEVSKLLDENPNVYIDFSARLDELGRQPYSSREFFMKHQDRIIFGTDMPADIETSADMYRCYFRFLETYDEGFYTPDYDGTFDRARWTICGIGLPDEVLRKVYYENIIKIIPSLADTIPG